MTHHASDHGQLGSGMQFTRARRVVPWLVALACTACHTWKVESLAAGQSARWEAPVRVVLNTGEWFEFAAARVTRDTLYGTSRRSTADSTVVIPVGRVVRVEARTFSEGRSFGAAVGAVVLTAALAVTVAFLTWEMTWNGS